MADKDLEMPSKKAVIACFKCGSNDGHVARDCTASVAAPAPRQCFACGSTDGHVSANCPNRNMGGAGGARGGAGGAAASGGGSGSPTGCFICGSDNHRQRDCPQAGSGQTGTNLRCAYCGQTGHPSARCTTGRSTAPRGVRADGTGATAGERKCYGCGGPHLQRFCPQRNGGDAGQTAQAGQAGAASNDGCRLCGASDHWARDCPNRAAGSDANRCFLCGGPHFARDCDQRTSGNRRGREDGGQGAGGGGGGARGSCFRCGSNSHVAKNCDQQARQQQICYKCRQPGHRAAECPTLANEE